VSANLGYPYSAYQRYFASPYPRPDYFTGLDPVAQGAAQADPMVAYGHAAGQIADPSSNYYRYILAQASRLHSAYDYETLQNQGRGSWLGYLNQHLPQVQNDWQQLAPSMRGESQRFAYGGGRWLG
jgi:hypothetical protein